MALILSIETADKGCSVALHQSGEILDEKTELDSKSSSSMLTSLISDVFLATGRTFGDLEAVAVSKGPGSYTGLRIGVSTAKGFCFALDLPMIAINTLDGLIEVNIDSNTDFICPMLDARRMEVYCKLHDLEKNMEVLETCSKVIDSKSFSQVLKGKKVLFCGPGAKKCKPLIDGKKNAIFEIETTIVHARNMGRLAYQAFLKQEFENLEEFEPFYLKDFMVKKSQKKMPLDNIQ